MSTRVYGGRSGADRRAHRRAQFVEAGLDLLGGPGGDQLTVRRVCERAGLTPRYFYESFTDRDALVSAIYDHVVRTIADGALTAVAAASGARAKIRAGLADIVAAVAGDPRHGRVLFSVTLTDPLLARRRVESSRFFAGLLMGQAREFYGADPGPGLELAAQFMVGGLSQTLSAWLAGTLDLAETAVVEGCAAIFDTVSRQRF